MSVRNPAQTIAARRIAAGALVVLGAAAFGISCGREGAGPVAPPAVASLQFARAVDTVVIGDSFRLAVRAADDQNRVIPAPPITWSTADTSIVRITGSVAHGLKLGTATVRATSGRATATFYLVVRNLPVVKIILPFTSRSVMEGDTFRIAPRPIMIDRGGDTVTDRTITYIASNQWIASVTPDGLVQGRSAGIMHGAAAIIVSADTATAQLAVAVTPAPVARISATPSSIYAAPGASIHVRPKAFEAGGLELVGRTFSFTSSDPSVAAWDSANGVIRGVAAGTTTLDITTGGTTAKVPVTVAPTGPGGFSIVIRNYGGANSAVTSAALEAAKRWARIITTPLVPYPVVGTEADSGACGPGTPAIHDTVQNVIVYVRTDSIDGYGKIAGEGGPCIYRNDKPQLAVVGFLTIDRADVPYLQQYGLLNDLLMHEIGHVLGIGTLWWDSNAFPGLASGSGTGDPVFTGLAARTASAALGFTSDSTLGVPLENTGGDGTRDGHWRGSVFGRELMTGTLHTNGNPVSRVTIEALADMGYGVAPSAADDFSVLNANQPFGVSAQRNVPRGGIYQIQDRIVLPRFKVTRGGRLIPVRPGRPQ